MTIRSTIKDTSRFAAILALALTAMATTSIEASALDACPGGGTRKCTFKCTGPVTKPVCQEVPPCTCTLGNKAGGNKAAGTTSVATRNAGGPKAGPLINRPPVPPTKKGGSAQSR
jgi:hypothetical protein